MLFGAGALVAGPAEVDAAVVGAADVDAGAGVLAGAVVMVVELGVFRPLVVAVPVDEPDEAVPVAGSVLVPEGVTPVELSGVLADAV